MKKKFLAFTLAEVLIVLGIIGIIANMTIPALVASNQKQVLVTQFKKFRVNFESAMKLYMTQQDCYDLPCTGLFNGRRSDNTWITNTKKAFMSMMKISKTCAAYTSDCYPNITTRDLNKSQSAVQSFQYAQNYVTADGALFMLWDSDSGNCTQGAVTTSKLDGHCGSIYVDTNGLKDPNMWGRDIFILYIAKDGTLYPMGGAEQAKLTDPDYEAVATYWKNTGDCGTEGSPVLPNTATGHNCGARIIEEGWSMEY